MAVPTRLDMRLDRAAARGDGALRVAGRWGEYLDALGADAEGEEPTGEEV